MTSEWYFSDDAERNGPHSEAEMATLIGSGELRADTSVWRKGMTAWSRLEDTPLAAHIKGPPPAHSTSRTAQSGPPDNTMAVVALIFAIVGLFTGVLFIPALVLGHMALAKSRTLPGTPGREPALAALIISYAVIALIALVIFAFIAFMAILILLG